MSPGPDSKPWRRARPAWSRACPTSCARRSPISCRTRCWPSSTARWPSLAPPATNYQENSMTERTTSTLGGDAPLSAARKPDPSAGEVEGADDDYELVGRTVSINRSRQDLYAFWRDFRNLPLFMENI